MSEIPKIVFGDSSKKLVLEDLNPELVFSNGFPELVFDIVNPFGVGIGWMTIGTTNIVG